MGRWVTLPITAGPKQGVLEFLLHSKLTQSREEQSRHDRVFTGILKKKKRTETGITQMRLITYYLAGNQADTSSDH